MLSPRCTFAISIATAKLPAWSRHDMVTCMVLRNKKWRLTNQVQKADHRGISRLFVGVLSRALLALRR